jgi:hypothetical protein
MLVARQGAKLGGYLIQHVHGEGCTIDDLSAEDTTVRSALLAEVTAIARKCGVHTVSMPCLATHPGKELLEQCGFRPRESSPVVLMALPQTNRVVPPENEWYLTSGDWES